MRGVGLLAGVLLALTMSAAVQAEPAPAPEKRQLAIEYLKLSRTQETFDSAIEAYVGQIYANNPSLDQAELRRFFESYLGWEVVREATIDLVATTFTLKELQSINRFYSSEVGRAYASKSPQLATGLSALISDRLGKAFSEINRLQ